jgi:hypothetical protein
MGRGGGPPVVVDAADFLAALTISLSFRATGHVRQESGNQSTQHEVGLDSNLHVSPAAIMFNMRGEREDVARVGLTG